MKLNEPGKQTLKKADFADSRLNTSIYFLHINLYTTGLKEEIFDYRRGVGMGGGRLNYPLRGIHARCTGEQRGGGSSQNIDWTKFLISMPGTVAPCLIFSWIELLTRLCIPVLFCHLSTHCCRSNRHSSEPSRSLYPPPPGFYIDACQRLCGSDGSD